MPPKRSPGPAQTVAGVVDEHRLEMLRLIDPADRSLLDGLVAGFLTEARSMLDEVSRAIDRGNRAELQACAQRFRGAALAMGLPALAAVAGELESLGGAGRLDGTRQLRRRLLAEFDRAAQALPAAVAARLHLHRATTS